MGLTKEEIERLLAKPQLAPRAPRKKGTTGIGGKKVDTTQRIYTTWFKLQHSIHDFETDEGRECENPDCVDPRPKPQAVSLVEGVWMCRYCFLAGYKLVNEGQGQLVE